MVLEVFTDPRYSAEKVMDIDPTQVVDAVEKTIRLFMGGEHRVTEVTLKSGNRYTLKGALRQELEAAQRQTRQQGG